MVKKKNAQSFAMANATTLTLIKPRSPLGS